MGIQAYGSGGRMSMAAVVLLRQLAFTGVRVMVIRIGMLGLASGFPVIGIRVHQLASPK